LHELMLKNPRLSCLKVKSLILGLSVD